MAARPPQNFPFAVSELTIRSDVCQRQAMVITPKAPTVIDKNQLAKLAKSGGLSDVERWLVSRAKDGGENSRLMLFRAVNERGQRVWSFDPVFSEADLSDAGYVLTKALLPFHRGLMQSGVVLLVHTDWGLRECYAMREGVSRCASELRALPEPNLEQQMDLWVLKRMLLHVALSLDHVVEKLVPAHLQMIERRWPRVQKLARVGKA